MFTPDLAIRSLRGEDTVRIRQIAPSVTQSGQLVKSRRLTQCEYIPNIVALSKARLAALLACLTRSGAIACPA